jgi:(p)ppGpp synthase/HD superfamily hydrolase
VTRQPALGKGPPIGHDPQSPRGIEIDRTYVKAVGTQGLAVALTRPYDSEPPYKLDIEALLRKVEGRNTTADRVLVRRAYEVAKEQHEGQLRQSGLPFITHPFSVATIAADLGLDTMSIIAALLHDVVDDAFMSLDEIEAQFGPEVGTLTDGLTKLDGIGFEIRGTAEAVTIRKIVFAIARDSRVLLIKLADRLHNMRDIGYLPREKQERKARETLEVYAAVAHRLEVHQVKCELEDLSFAALFPERYEEIACLIAERQPEREEYLAAVIQQLDGQLKSLNIRAEIIGRAKHYYSIYKKMVHYGKEFSDIFDVMGVRILTDSIKDCYAVLEAVHMLFKPVPGRFKDYIAVPKLNLYQTLHTTVTGPEGRPLEVQIRTNAMHRLAAALHYEYKYEGDGSRIPVQVQWSGASGSSIRPACMWTRTSSSRRGRCGPVNSRGAVRRAIDLAAAAHAGQTDRAGDPYIDHVLRVMEMVEGIEAKMVAVLHDVLEDTCTTVDDLRRAGMPEGVMEAVCIVTRGAPEPYGDYVDRIAVSRNELAIAVKLADLADNTDPARDASSSPSLRQRYAKAKFRLKSTALGRDE